MSREEYNEALNIAKGMRKIGQSELLTPTQIVVATPEVEVTIGGPSTSTPYVAISQEHTVRDEPSVGTKNCRFIFSHKLKTLQNRCPMNDFHAYVIDC